MDLDDSPVIVRLPPELTKALATKPDVKDIFDKMAPSRRKVYAQWILEAKGAETRLRRAAKAQPMIGKGQKL